MSTLGDRVVSNYDNSTNPQPGGDCFRVAYNRVNEASLQVCASGLPSMTDFVPFDRLWAVKNDPRSSWLQLPEQYRGKGSAGAMVSIGRGEFKSVDAIWAGELEAGAVVQTWSTQAGFEAARDGNTLPGGEIGHSFIFRTYVRDSQNQIIGLRIADQGTIWSRATNGIGRHDFGFWIAANIGCPNERKLAAEATGDRFRGYVRRINLEPIGTGRDKKLVSSAFLSSISTKKELQVYTDDPRMEAALLIAYALHFQSQTLGENIEVTYVLAGDDNIIQRIDLLERKSQSLNEADRPTISGIQLTQSDVDLLKLIDAKHEVGGAARKLVAIAVFATILTSDNPLSVIFDIVSDTWGEMTNAIVGMRRVEMLAVARDCLAQATQHHTANRFKLRDFWQAMYEFYRDLAG